jgi:hypothetical protein
VDNFQVESDVQTLIQAVRTEEFDRSVNGVLFREIKDFVVANFSNVSFSFCPRECNEVATSKRSLLCMVRSWFMLPKPFGRDMRPVLYKFL